MNQPRTIKEYPILMGGMWVRAILDGRKSQTRRPIAGEWTFEGDESGCGHEPPRCPFGLPGDRLRVRETYRVLSNPMAWHEVIEYRADGEIDGAKWKPSRNMRRADCRLVLEVTDIRWHRLQEIDHKEILAEGVTGEQAARAVENPRSGKLGATTVGYAYRTAWALLWNETHGDRKGCAWRDNPFVWAVTFRIAEGGRP
jgi:hypothetical protein